MVSTLEAVRSEPLSITVLITSRSFNDVRPSFFLPYAFPGQKKKRPGGPLQSGPTANWAMRKTRGKHREKKQGRHQRHGLAGSWAAYNAIPMFYRIVVRLFFFFFPCLFPRQPALLGCHHHLPLTTPPPPPPDRTRHHSRRTSDPPLSPPRPLPSTRSLPVVDRQQRVGWWPTDCPSICPWAEAPPRLRRLDSLQEHHTVVVGRLGSDARQPAGPACQRTTHLRRATWGNWPFVGGLQRNASAYQYVNAQRRTCNCMTPPGAPG